MSSNIISSSSSPFNIISIFWTSFIISWASIKHSFFAFIAFLALSSWSSSSIGLSTSFTNTAVGDGALFKSNAGGNTGLGANAGYHLTGAENTAVGNTTLQSTSGSNSGARNTAVGQGAGVAVTTGSNNSFFGHDGGANITTGSGNVIIGKVDAASATGSRQLKIAGNDGSTTTTWIEGDSDGTVSANGGHLTTTGKSLVFGF